jgi:hypothetical protein
MFGDPAGPAPAFGVPDGGDIVVGCAELVEASEDRRLCALRRNGWASFADRRGARTVMVGNTPGLAGELLACPRAGLTAAGDDCAWAEAACWSAGVNAAIKASLRKPLATPEPPPHRQGRNTRLEILR